MGHRKKMTVAAIAIRGNNVRDSPSRATYQVSYFSRENFSFITR